MTVSAFGSFRRLLHAAAGFAALALTGAAGLQAQLLSGNLIYSSIQPCRIIDTRIPGTPLVAGTTRTFNAAGVSAPGSLTSQGGNPNGCPIPGFVNGKPQVQAIAVNFVAVAAAGAGDLVAWPSDQVQPKASVINYVNSASLGFLNIANGVILPVRQDIQGNDISILAQVSGTGLVADVTGYFTKAPPRMYYLTIAAVTGANALTACAAGYHMASLWEIFNPAILQYNSALGFTAADSGAGPPAATLNSGWIRTGLRAIHANNIAGEDNCDAYTGTVGNGTVVALTAVWTGGATAISPWFPNDEPCVNMDQVWCVQD